TWKLAAGGPNSGIFKSVDGGDNWVELTRNPGLPEGDWGRVGLAQSAKQPNRISALIDSKEKNGLYQSEDGGETWSFISGHAGIIQRPFYYHHLHASPHNADELWVLSNKLWQSLDGGKTWKQRSGTKDDFHDMAFDPKATASISARWERLTGRLRYDVSTVAAPMAMETGTRTRINAMKVPIRIQAMGQLSG
ncbi:MAG: hypothetical protein ABGY42_08955, partial [bacterium]